MNTEQLIEAALEEWGKLWTAEKAAEWEETKRVEGLTVDSSKSPAWESVK